MHGGRRPFWGRILWTWEVREEEEEFPGSFLSFACWLAGNQAPTFGGTCCWNCNWGPLHTRDWEPVTITLQALSLVEKADPVQVQLIHTTLEGPMEYVNARWMSSLHGFLSGIDWIVFHGRLDYFQKPPLGGRSNVKPGDHGTPNVHNRWFSLCYHVWGPCMNKISLK